MSWAYGLERIVSLLVLGLIVTSFARANGFESAAYGKALYLGKATFSKPVTLGESAVELPAVAVVCANCHGTKGEGSKESSVRVPGLRWQTLLTPTATSPAYASDMAVLHAIEHGEGRSSKLVSPMPVYRLSDSERAALLAYLKTIGTDTDPDPGVSADEVRIGTVLPMQGKQRAHGVAIQNAMEEQIDRVNQRGGIFGRKLSLVVEGSDDAPGSSMAALSKLVNQSNVFAIVGLYAPEGLALEDEALSRLGTPLVAMLGVPTSTVPRKNVSYLMPSLEQQLTLVWKQLAQHCDVKQGILVLHSPMDGISNLLSKSAVTAGLSKPEAVLEVRQIDSRKTSDPLTEISRTDSRPIVALMNATSLATLRSSLLQSNKPRCLGSLAILSGANNVSGLGTSSKSGGIKELVSLPMQPVLLNPTQTTAVAGDLWQLLAELSIHTFVETISRSGRDLNQSTFDDTLISMGRFEPISGIRLEFTAQQRHGLTAASLWKGVSNENSK
jgi:mono/diheme cytochrome c family protein